jgi:hypothetical protein
MYVSTLGRIALRRWPLVILALLMTASGLYAASTIVRPEYKSSASVVLIPPKSLEEPDSNRYLALGSLDQAVGVLVRALTSDEVRDQVSTTAPAGSYEILADWSTSAPIIVVDSTAPTPEEADALLTAALAQIPTQLEELQTSIGVVDTQRITSLPLTRDAAPSRVLKPLLRALIATAVVLLGLSLGLIAIVDGLLLRQARRRREALMADELEADEAEVHAAPSTEAMLDADPEPDVDPDEKSENDMVSAPEPTPTPTRAPATDDETDAQPLAQDVPEARAIARTSELASARPGGEPVPRTVTQPGRNRRRQRNRNRLPVPAVTPPHTSEPRSMPSHWDGDDDIDDRSRAAG